MKRVKESEFKLITLVSIAIQMHSDGMEYGGAGKCDVIVADVSKKQKLRVHACKTYDQRVATAICTIPWPIVVKAICTILWPIVVKAICTIPWPIVVKAICTIPWPIVVKAICTIP